MEKWRRIWREGIVPAVCRDGLLALKEALEMDDIHLIQGATCYPPCLDHNQAALIQDACVIGFCAWKGEDLQVISSVETRFAEICDKADEHFNEPAIRYFLNWYDDTPREEMRKELLQEVILSLGVEDFTFTDDFKTFTQPPGHDGETPCG